MAKTPDKNVDKKHQCKRAFIYLGKGSFRRAAVDVCGCCRSVRCGKIEKFLFLQKRNRLPQPHASNADCLNEP